MILDLLQPGDLLQDAREIEIFDLVAEAPHQVGAVDHLVGVDPLDLRVRQGLAAQVGADQQAVQALADGVDGRGQPRRPAADDDEVVHGMLLV